MPAPVISFDPTALSKYGRLAFVARNLVEGFLTGVHKSPYKGFSVEFAEHRQYYPGDEIRHIDWRAFGKTDRYYIKEYEEETNLRAHLLVDASGSMKFQGGNHPSKFQYAQYLAASLAYLMLHQRDAVGMATHDTKLRQLIPPKANSKHLLRLIQTLEKTVPGGETSLAPLWHQLAERFSRRGLIVILSDCFDAIGPLMKALGHFRHQKHEILLFHILAPEVDPQRLRREYLKNFQDFCQQLRRQAGQMMIDYHLLRTDEPVEKALGVYLTKRQRQR